MGNAGSLAGLGGTRDHLLLSSVSGLLLGGDDINWVHVIITLNISRYWHCDRVMESAGKTLAVTRVVTISLIRLDPSQKLTVAPSESVAA